MNDPRLNHSEQGFPPRYATEARDALAATIAKLPQSAAAKLREFEDAALSSEGAVRVAQERRNEKLRPITMLRQAVAQSTTPHPANLERLSQLEPELEHVEEMLRRFQAERAAANMLFGGIQRALEGLPPNARFAVAEPPAPKKGDTLTSVRETIAGLKRDIHALETSAPTIEEQEAVLRAAIAKRGEIGRPRMDRSGRLRTEAAANAQAAALAVACWLDPEGVFEQMVADGALREGGSMSAAEKATQLADLRAGLFAAEVLEEALIQRDGGTRRADADPLAILGIRVEAGRAARVA